MKFKLPLIFTASMLVLGCDPGLPEGSNDYAAGGTAAALSQGEFNSLPAEQQYMVANKLLGTMFRGVSVEEYFDMNAGMANLQPRSDSFLQNTKDALASDMSNEEVLIYDTIIDGLDEEGNPVEDNAKYRFDSNRPRQLPLARIKEYPISRDMFVHWMAYVLSNTIMFSPALEMESTDMADVQNMYRFLVTNLENNTPIRQIIRSNLPSLARWRVSRSPENHALEAYELYLGLFETEEDSYRGGIACKDLYLTPNNEDYLIRRTDFPNTEPQLILDSYYVTTCDDLYDVIAAHPLLIPRVTEVIINYFFSGRPLDVRTSMIASITASNPETFEDIFKAIIFSKEYLLNTERPRSFEENLMSLLDTLQWDAAFNRYPTDEWIFRNMASNSGDRLYLGAMGWDVMALKIGRYPDVPLDGLSFANYHKALREEMFLDVGNYRGGDNETKGLLFDSEGVILPHVEQMSLEEYVDFLFLSAMQRKATAVEKTDLIALFVTQSYTTDVDGVTTVRSESYYDDIARVTFDYISRLPEQYYFRAVN
ncbi:MAG: hypothetical protein PVG45_03985 [Gammaproteobacteria bacterium]|jgi:hypothetical protein